MKVNGHLMSNWVKECPHEVSGEIITKSIFLKCSMVLAKGEYVTCFLLSCGIVPWYWRLLKYKMRKRKMEKDAYGFIYYVRKYLSS